MSDQQENEPLTASCVHEAFANEDEAHNAYNAALDRLHEDLHELLDDDECGRVEPRVLAFVKASHAYLRAKEEAAVWAGRAGEGNWRRLGVVTTDVAHFALVDPVYGRSLGTWWNERIKTLSHENPMPQTQEVELQAHVSRAWKVPEGWPQSWDGSERALLFEAPGNGGYDVDGRFEDLYGEGHETLVELRVRLHDDADDDDEEEEAAGS